MTATRTRPINVARRNKQAPTDGLLMHLLADTHIGTPGVTNGIPSWRLSAIMSDIQRGDVPAPDITIQLGDGTNAGTAIEMTALDVAFKKRVKGPCLMVMGNHDQRGQTVAQWYQKWGYTSQNYVYELGGVRFIVIGPDKNADEVLLSQFSAATLSWLDQQLSSSKLPCIISCHYPIWDTVGGSYDMDLEYTSRQAGFFISSPSSTGNSQSVLNVLAAHTNVKAWLSGHTHNNIKVPGLVMPIIAGGRRIAHVSGSCPWYQGKNSSAGGPKDEVNTCYAQWQGDRLSVRYRHHQAGQWIGAENTREFVVTGLG